MPRKYHREGGALT